MTASVLALPHPPPPKTAAELDAALVTETVRACREAFGDGLRAVILTGSVARGEGTWARHHDGATLLGDVEFLVLFAPGRRLPRGVAVTAVVCTIEDRLRRRRLRAEVTLAPCHAPFLSGQRPSIFAYELRACGRVVWGDAAALRSVPSFPAAEIPREDAWRLLCNRLAEQVEPLAHVPWPAAGGLPPAVRYRTAKLYLDMATSLLVFLDAYAPSYRERAERLDRLAEDGWPTAGLPLPLRDLARKVAACTRFKLDGQGLDGLDGWPAWREAVRQARELWRWETAALAGVPAAAADDVLRERWMSAQPATARLRGWLYVARAEGWRGAFRHGARWARLARRGSPRHCVYAAATDLLFTLAGVDGPLAELPNGARQWLPVPGRTHEEGGRTPVSALAGEVAANYHSFLVGTRA